MSFIDLFSGIGGFRLGLERNGFRCVWSNDIDKYASGVYRRHWNDGTHVEGDIRNIEAGTIPDHDILCAGFPCQAFSFAGKRRGFNDTRGTLFHEITRIARVKKPTILFLENVRGLLAHDRGQTFKVILEELGNLGYWIEWETLCSNWFGCPQGRERVFIIGHFGDEPTRTIFPIPAEINNPVRSSTKRELDLIPRAMLTPNRIDKRQNGRRLKLPNEPMFTITAQDKHGIYIGNKIRFLTPVEYERLQGFPDNWTKQWLDEAGEIRQTPEEIRRKQTGNAVTVNVIQFLGERIRRTFN